MSFQFRFAAIMQLHRRQRDEAGSAVGQAVEAIRRIDSQLIAIDGQRETLKQNMAESRTGVLSVDHLLAEGRYEVQLQADALSLQQTRTQLEGELYRRQQVLVAREAEVKKYERLESVQRERFEAELKRQEQNESDEAALKSYWLRKRGNKHDQ